LTPTTTDRNDRQREIDDKPTHERTPTMSNGYGPKCDPIQHHGKEYWLIDHWTSYANWLEISGPTVVTPISGKHQSRCQVKSH
jgi:hypothetical protein